MPHQNTQYSWYNPKRYDLGVSEAAQGLFKGNTSLSKDLGSNLVGGSQVPQNDIYRADRDVQREWAAGPDNQSYGYGESGYQAAKDASRSGQVLGLEGPEKSTNPAPSPQGINLKDPNANPGAGYFWDAADGWKRSGGDGAPDLYAEINSAFDDVLGGIGGQQVDLEGRVRTSGDTQKQGINEQLGYGIENLDTQRGNVRSNQASTLADLSQNLRDSARNVNMYLGARGAGNGSATQASSFALTKLFGKERAGVQKQGSQQLADIDMAETNLKSKASEMLNSVDTWVNSQMTDIATKFNDLRNNIGMMKGQMRAQAVESLWNEYNRVQSMREQYAMAIAESARSRLGQLNNLKLELSNSSNFDPQSMVFNEYGFNPAQSYMPEDQTVLNPLALARRKDEELN